MVENSKKAIQTLNLHGSYKKSVPFYRERIMAPDFALSILRHEMLYLSAMIGIYRDKMHALVHALEGFPCVRWLHYMEFRARDKYIS